MSPRLPMPPEYVEIDFAWCVWLDPLLAPDDPRRFEPPQPFDLFGKDFQPGPPGPYALADGRLHPTATMRLLAISIDRVDVVCDLRVCSGPVRRYSGPWLLPGSAQAPANISTALSVAPGQALALTLIPLATATKGHALVHLRTIFSVPR